jgi:hypothetical protein
MVFFSDWVQPRLADERGLVASGEQPLAQECDNLERLRGLIHRLTSTSFDILSIILKFRVNPPKPDVQNDQLKK